MNTRNKKVPLRWLSLEAMRDHLYSAKSDVWAFGVVLWEIGTLGGFPYPTVSNHELLTYLVDGRRLDRPENCSEHLYRLMLACWSEAPDERPEFADIVQHLEPNHGRGGVYVDFNELRKDYTFPPTREQVLMVQQQSSVQQSTASASTTSTETTATIVAAPVTPAATGVCNTRTAATHRSDVVANAMNATSQPPSSSTSMMASAHAPTDSANSASGKRQHLLMRGVHAITRRRSAETQPAAATR